MREDKVNKAFSDGDESLALGDYNKAIKSYKKAVKINPKSTKAWNTLGVTYRFMKKYDKAIQCFDKVLEIDPNDVLGWLHKGITYYESEKSTVNLRTAIECWDKMLEIEPRAKELLKKYGVLAFYEGYKDTLDVIEGKKAPSPTPKMWYEDEELVKSDIQARDLQDKMSAFAREGNYDEAIKGADELLAMGLNEVAYGFTLMAKGGFLALLGRNEEAIALYKNFIENNSTNASIPIAYNNLIRILRKIGNHEEAEKYARIKESL